MGGDDIKALPRTRADVSAISYVKSGAIAYKLALPIFNHTMTVEFRLKESAYYIIRHLWKAETYSNKFSIHCPYRVVKCVGVDQKTGEDYDYYYVEVMPTGIADRKIHFTQFLGSDQIDQINVMGFAKESCIVDRGKILRDQIEQNSEFLESKNDN